MADVVVKTAEAKVRWFGAWCKKAVQDAFSFIMHYVDKAISIFEEPGVTPPKLSAKRAFLAFIAYSFVVQLTHVTTLPGFIAVSAVHLIPAAFIVWAIRNKKA